MTSQTKALAEQYGIDLDDVAEWCGLHYGRDYNTESAPKKREWILRYAELHGLAPEATTDGGIAALASVVSDSASDDGCEGDFTVVSKSALNRLLLALKGVDAGAKVAQVSALTRSAQDSAQTERERLAAHSKTEHQVVVKLSRGYAVNGAITISQLETILADVRAFGISRFSS